MEVPDAILKRLSQTLYLRLGGGQITGRSISTGNRCSTTDPTFPCDPATVCRAFGHERVLAADRDAGIAVLTALIKSLCGPRAILKPALILHITDRPRLAITDAEPFFLLYLLEESGAYRGWVWLGRELSDEELRYRNFPDDGFLYAFNQHRVRARNTTYFYG